MSTKDKNFTGSIPDIYDEFLVPLIFESYASDMAKRVADAKPKAVLETAAGSGVVTRALAPLLSDGIRYVVTDLNQPMLDRASTQQPNADQLEWRQADALALPFEASTFDVVCCQFGVMFFPDKVAGYKEALRVLKDGGCFIFNVWDSIEENEFAHSVTKTASRFFPEDPPVFLARTPHGHGNIGPIVDDLKEAGFTDIETLTISEQSRASTPQAPAVAYCQGTPLRNELEERAAGSLAEITDAAAADIEKLFGKGPVSGKIQGHVFLARP
ncbi:class I SAM-dependent methyltransferase [Ruegeria arenilitoris]|uniref:class I SAM-dependent methyltransferase n=1 Tax=Ruegeria arenilitoris TaxID=1173585 RepID=UPI00147AAA63|nr:class I SAM-dependent methyltransferase [Ruegeria arenilitoris]